MTPNVRHWKYKNKADIEALSDDQLLKLEKDLADGIRLFNEMKTPMTDEMFWQLCVVPDEVKRRNLISLK